MRFKNAGSDSESVCPECLKLIPSCKISDGEIIFLEKNCPDHGRFSVKIWDGKPDYEGWNREKIPSKPSLCAAETSRGCPYDCGLCAEHRQQTCCVLIEITGRCNLKCPVCFASSGAPETDDPTIEEIAEWYRMLMESGGPFNIQLSGGEPTMRDDLPDIIRLGFDMGFTFIQLNTNGIRLANEPGYAEKLRDAGLNCVFLQFDGMNDSIHRYLRGADLMSLKFKTVENCAKAGLGVVLVPTLIPGINTDHIGEIIKFAIENLPHVRGVHFQPVSYFGRYPVMDGKRITIPEIIRDIEIQTGGAMKSANFIPPGGENPYCSFHGNFIQMQDGELKPWNQENLTGCCSNPAVTAEGSKKARLFVAKQWASPVCCDNKNGHGSLKKISRTDDPGINTQSLDIFLERVKTHTICISGMAFQDAWTMEINRLKECIIHVVSRDGKLIPFCAYNLTSRDGKSLYRGHRSGND